MIEMVCDQRRKRDRLIKSCIRSWTLLPTQWALDMGISQAERGGIDFVDIAK